MKMLEFDDIHRAYEAGVNVLDGVDFSVESGQVLGLLGKNGAGKTTLIRIALGLLEAQAGRVRILGRDPREEPIEVKRRVGYVSEDQILPPFLRVEQVVAIYRGLFPNWDDALAQRLSRRFGLPQRTTVKHLSKGQARQLALLCAISHRPELLLLDEPAGGLDPAARLEFLETSIQLINESGSTILFSSHHMNDIERMAGRVVMIHGGKVLIDRGLDALREDCCLALVPQTAGASKERLLDLEDCLGVRERPDALHAVFQLGPEQAAAALERRMGVVDARCKRIPLEEMFIELLGGQS